MPSLTPLSGSCVTEPEHDLADCVPGERGVANTCTASLWGLYYITQISQVARGHGPHRTGIHIPLVCSSIIL